MGTSGEQLRRTRPSLASLGRMVKRPRRDSGGTMPATVDSWRMRMAEPWTIKGEYLENCNCEVLCPCLLGPRNARGGAMARPTEGTCDVPVVFAVERGRFGTVALDGTHAALVVHTPGPMGEGNWTAGVYVDERATADQRRALESIFAGRAGGVMANIAALVTTWLPTRTVAIHFAKQGRKRSARIPGVLDVEIEGIEGRDGSEVWIDKVRHFVSSRLAAARATRSTYTDHGFDWSNVGRNGHYSAFDWSGGRAAPLPLRRCRSPRPLSRVLRRPPAAESSTRGQ